MGKSEWVFVALGWEGRGGRIPFTMQHVMYSGMCYEQESLYAQYIKCYYVDDIAKTLKVARSERTDKIGGEEH